MTEITIEVITVLALVYLCFVGLKWSVIIWFSVFKIFVDKYQQNISIKNKYKDKEER